MTARPRSRARYAFGACLRFFGATLMLITALVFLVGAGFLAYRTVSHAIEFSPAAAIGRFVVFLLGAGIGGPIVFGIGGGIAGALLSAGEDLFDGDVDGLLGFGGLFDSGGLLDLGGLASDIGDFASDIGGGFDGGGDGGG